MTANPIPFGEDQIPDGVYIGLPEEVYFRQRALGSSDLAYLWQDDLADGWWWRSNYCPFYRRTPSKATDFGSALHCLALEGRSAYEARYFTAPDPRQYPGLLETIEDLKSALAASEAPAMPAKARKVDLIEAVKTYCPGRPVWDDIEAKAKHKAQDRVLLGAETAYQIEVMVETGMKDPIMNAVFTAEGGVRLTEVSVFWTLPNGVRLRFRFDSLLPAANCDLKSIDTWRPGERLKDAAGAAIGKRSLDIQAALSFTARRRMYEHIEAGRIFYHPQPPAGSEDPQRQVAWLKRFPGEAPLDLEGRAGWRWLWAFFQKPTQDGRAPAILPIWMEFGSLKHRDGYRRAAKGMANFVERKALFGLDRPWTTSHPPHFFDDAVAELELEVSTPSWITQPGPVADEEEELQWQK